MPEPPAPSSPRPSSPKSYARERSMPSPSSQPIPTPYSRAKPPKTPTVYPRCPINTPGEPPLNENPQPPFLRDIPGNNGGVWRYAYRGLGVGGGRGKPPYPPTESVTSLRQRRPLCAASPSGASRLHEIDCTCGKGLDHFRACSFHPNGPAGCDPARRSSAAGRACSPGARRSVDTARCRRRELRSALACASACTAQCLCARSPRVTTSQVCGDPRSIGAEKSGGQRMCADAV